MSMSSTTLRCSEYSFRSHSRCVEAMQGSNYPDSPVDAGPCARCRWVLVHEWEMKRLILLNSPEMHRCVYVCSRMQRKKCRKGVCVCVGRYVWNFNLLFTANQVIFIYILNSFRTFLWESWFKTETDPNRWPSVLILYPSESLRLWDHRHRQAPWFPLRATKHHHHHPLPWLLHTHTHAHTLC